MPTWGRSIRWAAVCVWMLGCGTRTPTSVAEAADSRGVRRAACADDMWYPSTREALAKKVDALLDQAGRTPVAGRVHAMVSPHAGMAYSGRGAAANYRLLRGCTYDRVIAMGPTHRTRFRGVSAARYTHYETPLGRIPIDQPVVEALLGTSPFTFHPEAHAREHSVEIQLPFLQRVLGSFKLVVLVVGEMAGGDFARAADALRAHVTDKTLVVASSDFTHYGRRFGYAPFGKKWRRGVRLLDLTAVHHIQCQDSDAFLDFCRDTGATICGRHPIGVLLKLQPGRYSPMLMDYYTSADLGGDTTGSVSYVSLSFFDPPTLSDMQRRTLMAVACKSLHAAAGHDRAEPSPSEVRAWPEVLRMPAPVFVTLKKGHELRGCIGELTPQTTLGRAVYTRAYSAARSDRRFKAITPQELDGLTVTVSVLSPLRPVVSYKDIRLGHHGIILQKGKHQALYLPEVATEQGWDHATTLSHLCRKAGLPREAWQEDVRLYVFTTDRFSAPYKAVKDAGPEKTWKWIP